MFVYGTKIVSEEVNQHQIVRGIGSIHFRFSFFATGTTEKNWIHIKGGLIAWFYGARMYEYDPYWEDKDGMYRSDEWKEYNYFLRYCQ